MDRANYGYSQQLGYERNARDGYQHPPILKACAAEYLSHQRARRHWFYAVHAADAWP